MFNVGANGSSPDDFTKLSHYDCPSFCVYISRDVKVLQETGREGSNKIGTGDGPRKSLLKELEERWGQDG